jgi:alkylation response protein AidB-like acyl-CoA dehydrogenase
MVAEFADEQLAPRAAAAEAAEEFPREILAQMGQLGLLTLPIPESLGGGGQGYQIYLQVLEEISTRWASIALSVSVNCLAYHPVVAFGSDAMKSELLPTLLSGNALGAYCLSEVHAGSDPSAIRTSAKRDGNGWVINGTKAWVTHGSAADFYIVFARTSDDPSHGISCFYVPSGTPGMSIGKRESKMGLTSSPTVLIHFDNAYIEDTALMGLIGDEGDGLRIALSALDAGRLGIAAIATGLAQAALNYSLQYAMDREAFDNPIIEYQGVSFMLADMDAQIQSAREMYLAAARLKDSDQPYSREASISKLMATDAVMRITTDAVQVLGGAGYTRDHPVERYMREAKVMQIFEGTNQIQRMVIARHLVNRNLGKDSR